MNISNKLQYPFDIGYQAWNDPKINNERIYIHMYVHTHLRTYALSPTNGLSKLWHIVWNCYAECSDRGPWGSLENAKSI